MAGAFSLGGQDRQSYETAGWLMDDEGDNISFLNSYFGDLTVLYWAWKNAPDDHLGVCQYRRPRANALSGNRLRGTVDDSTGRLVCAWSRYVRQH